MEERMHIVILAAGDFPVRRELISLLADASSVVCCDSAYKGLLAFCREKEFQNSKFKIQNCFVVGDGDSLPEELKRELGDRWIHVSEQDYNDLHKAMSWAASKFKIQNSKFIILGATGRREDHTLGNISYLVTFAEEHPGVDIEMLTDHGRFTAMRGCRTYSSFPGQQVSIFSMEPEQPIYSSGLKWPLDGLKACRWWQATLNESLADSFELHSEGWIIVFQNW